MSVGSHPLFLTGNIEHLGTGTTDMIRDCEAEGLRSPEFIQEEDFRVVIWRKVTEPVAEKVIELTGKVIESGEKVIELRLTKKQLRVLDFCEEMPRSAQEILEFVGVKYQTKTVKQYVTKLVEDAYATIVTGAVGGAAGVIHAASSAHTDCEPNANVEAMRVC